MVIAPAHSISDLRTRPFSHLAESTRASSTVTLDGYADGGLIPPLPSPPWTYRLSTSFSAMAEQISAVSQALAQIPSNASLNGNTIDIGMLSSRMAAIERTQERLNAEFEALKSQFTSLNTGSPLSGGLEQRIDDLSSMMKLGQSRLYACLHNSNATLSKMSIKPLLMANGKFPENFPATKGEFEHLTKERYEAILKAYDLPIKGDTAAKREALRVFIGLPA